MFFVQDQPSKLLYVVGDDPVIKGLSLLQLWKKPVTLGPGHVRMLGQLRIFERSHLNKVSFELHLPWRVGVNPFSYKTGCTSQSCQNSLITFLSI